MSLTHSFLKHLFTQISLFTAKSGTPWTPAPVAEDYEETIQILLESHKVRRRGREGEEEGKRAQ